MNKQNPESRKDPALSDLISSYFLLTPSQSSELRLFLNHQASCNLRTFALAASPFYLEITAPITALLVHHFYFFNLS